MSDSDSEFLMHTHLGVISVQKIANPLRIKKFCAYSYEHVLTEVQGRLD